MKERNNEWRKERMNDGKNTVNSILRGFISSTPSLLVSFCHIRMHAHTHTYISMRRVILQTVN